MAVRAHQAAIADFVQTCFPNQYLIPIKEYSVVMSESYGAVRNRIAAGTFELPLVKKGSRNFITAPDLVELLGALQPEPGQTIEASEPEPASPRVKEEEEGTTTRRPKYGFEARSRAAASKKKRQVQASKARAAKSTIQKNEEVAA